MMKLIEFLREDYTAERAALGQHFLKEQEVDRYLHGHSDLVDRLVKALAVPFLELEDFCVLATAGYGRREQFPQSDVDLLVVHEATEDRRVEKVVGSFLQGLWDVRLRLGHQVWSAQELGSLSLESFEFVVALLDARILTGNEELGRAILNEILPRFLGEYRSELVQRVVKSAKERHEAYGNTIYQLEPDLKEAPGALRDYLLAIWLLQLDGKQDFLPFGHSDVLDAHQFMKKLRTLLHLETGNIDNRLTHRLQEAVATHIVHSETDTQEGVESLMKEYFLNARVIARYCESVLSSVLPAEESQLVTPDELPPISSVSHVLEVLAEVRREGRTLDDGVRQAVEEALPDISSNLRFSELKEPLSALLTPQPGLYKSLSVMYELGILELLFPEFGTIKARVIRDFYHKYTVDEHTLIAIKSIEDLVVNDETADGRFISILEDTVVPYHVTLALLLHDVGKGRGGKHTEESARMAVRALRRFRFEPEEINTIAFLIRNHLAMSAVVFRRDLEDEEVIERFSNLVEDPEKLRLLTLLTYADIKAVAPGTLNDWKKDLLWQLYLATYRKLTLEVGEARIEEEDIGEKLLSGLESDLDPATFESFLEGFPVRYLRSTPPKEIYEHFRMAASLGSPSAVKTRLFKRKTHYELCIVTPDRSRIFAKIVGLLSYFGMNILKGYGFANHQRILIDFFQFSDPQGGFKHRVEKKRFQDLLRDALDDRISVKAMLERKEQSILFRKTTTPGFSPTVYFEDEHSDRYTIMEIIAPDAAGLLYRISKEIAELDCDIDLAFISTEGEKAVDVFYLRHEGGKIPPELKLNLSEQIVGALS